MLDEIEKTITSSLPFDIKEYINTLTINGIVLKDNIHSVEHKNRKKEILKEQIQTVSPSRFSIILTDDHGFDHLIGSCSREIFFSSLSINETNEASPASKYKMSMGKSIELEEQECITYGLELLSPELKAKTQIFHNVVIITKNNMFGVNVFGEIDILLVVDGHPIPLEIKSFYGYEQTKHIFGNKSQIGRPKENYFLQIAGYVYLLQDPDKYELYLTNGDDATHIKSLINKPCPCGINKYIDRTSGQTTMFEISVKQTGQKTTDGFNDYEPLVDGYPLLPITIKDIFLRCRDVSNYIERAKSCTNITDIELPPRDSIYQYSKERLSYYRTLNDSKYMNKGEREIFDKTGFVQIGDYQCSYCRFKNLCLGDYPDSKLATDQEIKDKIIQISRNT
jgi:hypothetical protein